MPLPAWLSPATVVPFGRRLARRLARADELPGDGQTAEEARGGVDGRVAAIWPGVELELWPLRCAAPIDRAHGARPGAGVHFPAPSFQGVANRSGWTLAMSIGARPVVIN